MITVGFIVTSGFPVMSLAALSVFEFANIAAAEPIYDIMILSEYGGPIATSSGVMLMTAPFPDTSFDTLIIGGNTEVVPTSPRLAAFLIETGAKSRRLASICTGAFALADAGLLQGRQVTTHWAFTEAFRTRFPDLDLLEDRLFVVDGAFWTAAGNSAGIDLTLCMLENDLGLDAARAVGKTLVIDYQRTGGRPQSSVHQALAPRSDRIHDVLLFVRSNLGKSLSVDDLARVAGLSPRQFSRAFGIETGTSPAKAVESLRVEAARQMVEQSRHSIEVIATETGFGDEERMRRAFRRAFGRSPQAMRHAERA